MKGLDSYAQAYRNIYVKSPMFTFLIMKIEGKSRQKEQAKMAIWLHRINQ